MSDTGNAAQAAVSQITAEYNNKLNRVAPGAVAIQLGLMVLVGLGALTAFSILRPNNSMIYQPKVKYSEDGKQPPKLDKGVFSWIKPVFRIQEPELMQTVGLDGVVFLRFLRLCRLIFFITAVLTCAVLIPINVAYNLMNVKSNNRNYLLMLTISNVRGEWLWAPVVMTYLLTAIVCFLIWRNWEQVCKLRWQWFRSDEYQNTLHARSLIVTQVPKSMQTDQGLLSLLHNPGQSSLSIPYPTTAVHIGRRVGGLPELIEKHNDAVRSLEQVLTSYFKDPNRVPTKRPTKRIGGWMCLGGKQVDAIDYYTEKIKRLEDRIEYVRQQIHERKAENYGFASFETVPYAHVVAKKLRGKRKSGAHFDLAPAPKDIIWDNIIMSDQAKRKNKFFGGILLAVFMFFYLIPLVVVSLLANLAALGSFVGFINSWQDNYPALFSAFIGIVPPLLSLLLQLFIPVAIRWIASLQGSTTHSQSDRIVTARYSAFLFITQFIIFSLLGVLIQIGMKLYVEIDGRKSIGEIWEYLKTIPDQFQSTYIIQSSYWLTILPLRGASSLFDLAQLISLIYVWFRTRLFGRTPREIREWTKPPEFDFPVYYSNHILLVIVGLVYAPLAPLVPLFAAAAFAISVWVYKYQLMYMCVSRVETGGRLWNVCINRILWALITMHVFMGVSICLQTNYYYAIALVPPIIGVIIFKIILTRQFDDRFRWYIPSPAEMAASAQHHADARKNRLQKRFGHPSLNEPLFTPMLHKKVQHLLPTIYHGRIGQSTANIEGKVVEQNQIGGLTFNMLEQHDLMLDRQAYLAQRDEDAMTVSSAAILGQNKALESGIDDDDYFSQRRAEYMKHGAVHGGSVVTPGANAYGTPIGTPDDLPFELSRMPQGSASTEQLIQYPPSYSSPQSRVTGNVQSTGAGVYGTPSHQQAQRSFGSRRSFDMMMAPQLQASLPQEHIGHPIAIQTPGGPRPYVGAVVAGPVPAQRSSPGPERSFAAQAPMHASSASREWQQHQQAQQHARNVSQGSYYEFSPDVNSSARFGGPVPVQHQRQQSMPVGRYPPGPVVTAGVAQGIRPDSVLVDEFEAVAPVAQSRQRGPPTRSATQPVPPSSASPPQGSPRTSADLYRRM
ncbi:hypothetical protein OIO90_004718 [Microbotryomycetes sp. JL221]|nr:hypothetical protein OIO90_004718 [Microbotryomycetes sp. JL221]